MSAKHTPGPWDVVGKVNAEKIGVYADGYRIATVHNFNGRDENNANARLIAAAPHLLDALQGCMEYLSCIPESAAGGDDDAAALCRIARAAIAKATGASA